MAEATENASVSDVLKEFVSKVTTSRVNERLSILIRLQPHLEKPDFPESAQKGVLRVLLLTLGLYSDAKSRRSAENVVRILTKTHFSQFGKIFNSIVGPIAEPYRKGVASRGCASTSFNALSWCCTLSRHGYSTAEAQTGNEFNRLVELQALFLFGTQCTEKASIATGAYYRLKRIWSEIPGSLACYVSALKSLEPGAYMLSMIGCIMKYLKKTKNQAEIQKYKEDFLAIYLKHVLGSRTKPPLQILVSSKDLLCHISHDQFKSTILPAMDKAMLRNPEISIQAVCQLISGLSIDLSPYGFEIGKLLATHTHSKEDEFRDIAVDGCRHLAKQCSDLPVVEKLIKHFFSVFNGSEGKLTVLSQRMGMLSGVGNLSYSAVTGANNVQNLATTVAEHFISVLQQEVHEGILVHSLANFQLWCSKFSTEVPVKLVEWFKAGMSQRGSTTAVRNAYIQCMGATFQRDTLSQAGCLVDILVQSIDKASAQPTQYGLVTEALSATCLLLWVSLADIQADTKLAKMWAIVQDQDKLLFVNEKYLSTASEDAFITLALLVERLVNEHPQKLAGNSLRPYLKGLVYTLLHPSYKVRRQGRSAIKRIYNSLGGSKTTLSLVQEYQSILSQQQVPSVGQETDPDESFNTRTVRPRHLVEALISVTNIPRPEDEAELVEAVAMATLIDAHHPCIAVYDADCWVNILSNLKIDAANFIRTHLKDILSTLKNTKTMTESEATTISTIVRIVPEDSVPQLLDQVSEILSKDSLMSVTLDEYNIMLTPPGELYDKTVIQPADQAEAKSSNIKREQKLYSYAEQMAELELRKELAKKKGKVKEEPKLSKKQQEAIHVQLQKEQQIRDRLMEVSVDLQKACCIVSSFVKGNPDHTRLQLPQLLKLMWPLLRSPLAAPKLVPIIVELRKAAFEGIPCSFDLLLVNSTLRSLEPLCELGRDWSEEPLRHQASRLLNLIHEMVVPPKGQKKSSGKKPFPATTFCLVFPFIKYILKNPTDLAEDAEQAMTKALHIVLSHVRMRADPKVQAVDENGPELLPREEILQMLIYLVGTNVGVVQQMAAQAVMDTVDCASGDEGCAIATQKEIDVLLKAVEAPSSAVRRVALEALQLLIEVLPSPDHADTDYQSGLYLIKTVWIACFDIEEEIRILAKTLREDAELDLCDEVGPMIVQDVIHTEPTLQQAAAEALAAFIQQSRDQVDTILPQLLDLYQDMTYLPPPVLDTFGRVVSEAPPDNFAARSGIGTAIEMLSPYITQQQIGTIIDFFVQKGLGDRHEDVRKCMRSAAVAVINEHGKANVGSLLPVMEDFLENAPNLASFDAVRQSVVILMGSLAKHLDKDDPKVRPIVAKLIEILSTPSQQVQEAVANCLPPLVPAIKDYAPDLVKKLLRLLLESENYGERRGAAYGLAGLVKGLGILALKQQDIMTTLTDAIQNKKNPRYREGALFAIEMLCLMLGRLFEPYVVHILPHLLLCFGDSNQYVREAADDTAKAVMSKLSAHGVKLILPSLLTALEEDAWRTKTGSAELLGAMAFCAPKQLSACLPSIVPKLIEVLTDSHLKVQKAGAQALKQIGSVIRNPEIQAIVPILLEALQDPTKKTTTCLKCLLGTKFVHFIDAPSLALIMPVVQRSFQDRSTETRKMAAQIIGNMYSLTDQKDLSPYLPSVIPGLKQSLLDPVPEVRSVSSRALGAMVKGMGESGFEELVPWLMETLTSESSSVDRSGAAQGLSEVVGGLGLEKLNKLMPDIIATAERTDIAPHIRDGYIMMYIYLPTVFGEEFISFVGPSIPSILKALADESEFVRETALKAGQRVVNMYADTAIELLLPELERGLFDDNWRIRSSSVQLLGDLLYKLSGVSGKMTTETADEDDNFGTESSQQAILRALGSDTRNRVLAGLYMGRSDTALMVRQAALHVWKIIVTHTPKTLREILSTLFELLLGCLASQSYDKRQVAARTLGDIVRKLGEKVLPEIIPILERGLESEKSDQRQGVCIGLSEIMTSTSRDHVIVFADSLIPTVRKALCDPLPEVREAAADTFDNLHANIGPRTLDDILPVLLRKLDDPDVSEFALDGLKQVMAVKSRVVLPYLVPQLTSPPVNTRALAFLSSVAGDSLTRHLGTILPALISTLADKMGSPEEKQEVSNCQSVVLSITDELGIRTVIEELLSATSHQRAEYRSAAVLTLHAYCDQTKADYSEYVPSLFRGLIRLFIDSNERVLNSSWDCLHAVTKKLDTSDMLQHIPNIRQAVRYAVSDHKGDELPGFCLPKKGITPILPIFREGLLNGPAELKESAAIGLGEVIRKTSADALKPSVVNITGPLIRILGERFLFNVKVAVLETLGLLLGKCGAMLRPFLPQLQTTFVKALNDPNRTVRLKAATALGSLVIIHPRVDPLFTELHNSVTSADDSAVRDTMLQALRGCIIGAGAKMGVKIRKEITASLEGYLSMTEDTTRTTAAACLGTLCPFMTGDELSLVLNMHLLDTDASVDWMIRHARSVGLSLALRQSPETFQTEEWKNRSTEAVITFAQADRVPVCLGGLRGIGYMIRHQVLSGSMPEARLLAAVNKCMKHDSNDVKALTAQLVCYVAKSLNKALDPPVIKSLIPMLVNGTKEKNTLVKTNSELGLVALLRLRYGEDVLKACMTTLEPGMGDSLTEVVNKVLKKTLQQPDLDEDIDDTMLV